MLRFDGSQVARELIICWFGNEAGEVRPSPRSRLQMWVNERRARGVPELLLSLAMVVAGTFDGLSDSNSLWQQFRKLPSRDFDFEQWGRFYEDWTESILLASNELFPGRDLSLIWSIITESENNDSGEEVCRFQKVVQRHPQFEANLCRSILEMLVEITDRLAALATARFHLVPVDDEAAGHVIGTPAVQFLVFVCLPCFIEYGCSPGELFKRATIGNEVDVMEYLLRIDHRLSDQPEVGQVIRDRAAKGDRLFLNVLNGDRSREKSWGQMDLATCSAAALVELSQMLSRTWNRNDRRQNHSKRMISAADLRKLFQSIGFDPQRNKRGQPTEDGTWARRIQRKRKEWNLSDKSERMNVSDRKAS